jgi:hypothetical protein
LFAKGFRSVVAVAAIAFAVSACQSGGGASRLNLGLGGGKPQPAREQVSESVLRAYCPHLQLRSGTAFYTAYKNRAEQTAKNVIYQASIDEVTRSCVYNADGSATMTVAAAGKVVTGPAGSAGTINLPIRVAVLRSGEVVASTLHKYAVAVTDTSGATQFIYNDPTVVIPGPVDRSLQVFVGFDRGPPNQ